MTFTTVDAVATHYPEFRRRFRGADPFGPQIEGRIARVGARLTTLAAGRGYILEDLSNRNPQAYALLSLINEVGAAAHLGEALQCLFGPEEFPRGWANPESLRRSYESMVAELRCGTYDRLFQMPSHESRIPSPEPVADATGEP
jgi:hypothetical protein